MEKNQFNLFPQNVQKLFPFFTLEPQEEHIDSLSNLFPQFMQKESSFLTLAPHDGHFIVTIPPDDATLRYYLQH